MRVAIMCVVFAGVAWAAPLVLVSPNAQSNDMFGFALANVGDVNGDGVADVAVSAPHESTASLARFGRVYIYSGKNGALLRTLNSPTPVRNGAFGFSLAGIPDVNNDYVPDVIVGAPVERVGGENIGRVHVHSGANGAHLRSFNGFDAGILAGRAFEFGTAVAVYGNANGDNVPDLVVGAPGWSILSSVLGGGFLSPGRAFLVDGLNGSLLQEYIAPNGTEEGSFGAAVAVLGDITGDGHAEVVIGAPTDREGQIRPGRAYVFNGATGAQLYSLSSLNPINSGRFGANVKRIEDINGDALPDIIVTADNEKVGAYDAAGRVYLFSGATGSHLLTINSPDADDLMFFGNAVDVVADFSGDGLDDLAITVGTGTRLKQQAFPLRAFIMNSLTGAIVRSITIHANDGAPLFGSAVAGIGDMDNDGKEDIAFGSTFGQGGFAARGYIARSRDFAPSPVPPPTFECFGGMHDRATPWADMWVVAVIVLGLWAGRRGPRVERVRR